MSLTSTGCCVMSSPLPSSSSQSSSPSSFYPYLQTVGQWDVLHIYVVLCNVVSVAELTKILLDLAAQHLVLGHKQLETDRGQLYITAGDRQRTAVHYSWRQTEDSCTLQLETDRGHLYITAGDRGQLYITAGDRQRTAVHYSWRQTEDICTLQLETDRGHLYITAGDRQTEDICTLQLETDR